MEDPMNARSEPGFCSDRAFIGSSIVRQGLFVPA